IARLTTASPRNSRRSLWPRAASLCSWCQLEWTRACSSRSRSRTGSPIFAAHASAGRTLSCSARRPSERLGGVLVDVIDGVLDGADLLRILVRDLRPELLLEAHDELDEIEGVGVEIVHEGRLRLDLLLIDTELLDDDLLQALVGRCGHCGVPSPWSVFTSVVARSRPAACLPRSGPFLVDACATCPRTPFTRRRV